MRAATCFSGIGAPECAMPSWDWLWSAEIEPFPAAVLAARHPGSVNLGDVLSPDFDDRAKALGPIDVLVGGFPCQSFSVAGNRGSLSEPRGNLSLRWIQVIHAIQPVFSVSENVPGWLNTPDDAFGHFLGALVGADDPLPAPNGQGWPRAGMVAGPLARACWRILDAQYFGLAQRRERVFIVSSARDWADPCQILFEPKSLRRDTPSRRETRQGVARPLAACPAGGSGYRNDADTADNLIAFQSNFSNQGVGSDIPTMVANRAPAVAYDGLIEVDLHDASLDDVSGTLDCEIARHRGHGVLAFDARQNHVCQYGDLAGPLDTHAFSQAVSFAENSRAEVRLEGGDGQTVASLKTGGDKPGQSYPAVFLHANKGRPDGRKSAHEPMVSIKDVIPTLATDGHAQSAVATAAAIRRLLPIECERLQGFYDHYTNIVFRGKPAADGNRYRALGNSMAVPCVEWILTRIELMMSAEDCRAA